MAISVIDSEYGIRDGYFGNPKTFTINKPSGVSGDRLICVIGSMGNNHSISGFTEVIQKTYTDYIDRRIEVFTKLHGASEPSSYTINQGSYGISVGIMFTIRDQYETDLGWQVKTVGNDYNTTRTLSGVTTLNDNATVFSVPCWVQYRSTYQPTATISWSCPQTTELTPINALGFIGDDGSLPYSWATSYMVSIVVGHEQKATAGLNNDTVWTRTGSGLPSQYGGNSMGIQFVVNSQGAGGGGTCTCNAICDNDCGSNQICTGHAPVCANSYTFDTISIGTIVLASHLRDLETAINDERGSTFRRYYAADPTYCLTHTPGDVACSNNTFGQWSFQGGVAGEVVEAADFNEVVNANNEVVDQSGYGTRINKTFANQEDDPTEASVIYASAITLLQDSINATRNACICDSHCNCDPSDCGCNGECPSDDYYYYV